MNLENLTSVLPRVDRWIDSYIEEKKDHRITLASTGFERMKACFSSETLENSFYAVVERIETPPLSEMGLSEFSDFEIGSYGGITYKDTYFVTEREKGIESLHFHEMVHIVQWHELGAQNFILLYAVGLVQCGYRSSPLEAVAYELQDLFEKNRIKMNCEGVIREHSRKLLKSLKG
ncbi:MAG: hypothetical protein AAF065_06155 [Verrucomicrobiota bacterium]